MASGEQGKVVKSSKLLGQAGSAMDAFSALNNMVEATREYFVVREQEATKRAEISTYEKLELSRISAAENVLKDYFRAAFAERAQNVEALLHVTTRRLSAGMRTLRNLLWRVWSTSPRRPHCQTSETLGKSVRRWTTQTTSGTFNI